MKKLLLVTSMLFSAFAASAQKHSPQSYIDEFKEYAIRIMHETGVPASVILGVAMHESGCGNSALAKNLNNQFGVKGSGHITYVTKKKTVRTAYKRYGSVYDSFQDFARIMTERTEFNALAQKFPHFDYNGWALGIAHHGYASDPSWAKSVLGIIKKYQLYTFDENPQNQQPVVTAQGN